MEKLNNAKEKLIILDQIKRGIQKEVEVKKQAIIKEIGEGLTKILDATIKNSDALDQTLENYFSKLRVSLTAPPKLKAKDNVTITIEEDIYNYKKEQSKPSEKDSLKRKEDTIHNLALDNVRKDDKTKSPDELLTEVEKENDESIAEPTLKDIKKDISDETSTDESSKINEFPKTSSTVDPTNELSEQSEKDTKKLVKPSKLVADTSEEENPEGNNESVYDAATGKYGIWVDVGNGEKEFVIDANKRHEDDPNSIIKQEIKEEPGMLDDMSLEYMDDGMMDMNNNMLPVFKDEDYPDMNYPLDPSMMDGGFGMGGGDFGAAYNMHMPNDFGSLGSVGNLHGPSSAPSKGGLGIAGFAKESQFGSTKPKFGHSPLMSHSRPLLAPAKPLGVGFGKATEIGITNDDLPPPGLEPLSTGKVQRPDLVNAVVSTFAQTHEVVHPNDMNDSIRKNWVVYIGTVEGGDKYKCRDCPYTSPGKGNIVLHVKRVHFKIKRDQCDFCPFSASTKQELVGHVNSTHHRMTNGDYEFNCTQCPYTTKFRQSLNGHVKYTHQKFVNYGCDKCRFYTYQEEKLDEHVTQNHGHENPLSCMNCTYVTGKQRFLQRHMAACAIRA